MIDPLSYKTESFHLLTWQVTNATCSNQQRPKKRVLLNVSLWYEKVKKKILFIRSFFFFFGYFIYQSGDLLLKIILLVFENSIGILEQQLVQFLYWFHLSTLKVCSHVVMVNIQAQLKSHKRILVRNNLTKVGNLKFC